MQWGMLPMGRFFSNAWTITIIGGVIVAVITTVIFGSTGTDSRTKTTHSPEASPTATSTVTGSPGPEVTSAAAGSAGQFIAGSNQLPQQLTGTWQGTVFQASSSQSYLVILQLAGSPGSIVGTSSYPTLNCQGKLE